MAKNEERYPTNKQSFSQKRTAFLSGLFIRSLYITVLLLSLKKALRKYPKSLRKPQKEIGLWKMIYYLAKSWLYHMASQIYPIPLNSSIVLKKERRSPNLKLSVNICWNTESFVKKIVLFSRSLTILWKMQNFSRQFEFRLITIQ